MLIQPSQIDFLASQAALRSKTTSELTVSDLKSIALETQVPLNVLKRTQAASSIDQFVSGQGPVQESQIRFLAMQAALLNKPVKNLTPMDLQMISRASDVPLVDLARAKNAT